MRTNDIDAHGQVVWSWHPGADAKFVCSTGARATGARKPVPGESTKQLLKPIAQGRPDAMAMPVVPAPCTFSRTGAMGGGQAPGLPCALCFDEGERSR